MAKEAVRQILQTRILPASVQVLTIRIIRAAYNSLRRHSTMKRKTISTSWIKRIYQQKASNNFKCLHSKPKKEMIQQAQEPQIEMKLILKVYVQLLVSDHKWANSSLDIRVTTKMSQGNPVILQAIKTTCKMIGIFHHIIPTGRVKKVLEKQVNLNPIPIHHRQKQNRISHRWPTTRVTSI